MPLKRLDVSLTNWKWEGVVLVGGTPAIVSAYVKRELDIEVTVGKHSAGHAYVGYGEPWVLWVESLDNVPTLAHEALHVTNGVLQARGVKPSAKSEEAYTYTMEYIIDQALQKKRYRRVK